MLGQVLHVQQHGVLLRPQLVSYQQVGHQLGAQSCRTPRGQSQRGHDVTTVTCLCVNNKHKQLKCDIKLDSSRKCDITSVFKSSEDSCSVINFCRKLWSPYLHTVISFLLTYCGLWTVRPLGSCGSLLSAASPSLYICTSVRVTSFYTLMVLLSVLKLHSWMKLKLQVRLDLLVLLIGFPQRHL